MKFAEGFISFKKNIDTLIQLTQIYPKQLKGFLMRKFIVLVLIFGLFACQKVNKKQTLVVAVDLNNPPFEYENREGFPSGKTIDYAEKLADYLHYELKLVSCDRDQLTQKLKSGKADIVLSSYAISDDRKNDVLFSNPYYEATPAILISKESNFASFSEVVEGEISMAVRSGSWEAKLMHEYFNRYNLIICDGLYECAEAVIKGKADAMLSNRKSIEECAYRYENYTEIMKDTFPEVVVKWGVAVKYDQPELLEKINTFIKKNPFEIEGP